MEWRFPLFARRLDDGTMGRSHEIVEYMKITTAPSREWKKSVFCAHASVQRLNAFIEDLGVAKNYSSVCGNINRMSKLGLQTNARLHEPQENDADFTVRAL